MKAKAWEVAFVLAICAYALFVISCLPQKAAKTVPTNPYADAYIIPGAAFDHERICIESRSLGLRPSCITVGDFRRYVAGHKEGNNDAP